MLQNLRGTVAVEHIGDLVFIGGDVNGGGAAQAWRAGEHAHVDLAIEPFLALGDDLDWQCARTHQRGLGFLNTDLEGQFLHHRHADLVDPRLIIHAAVAVLHEVKVLPNPTGNISSIFTHQLAGYIA